jgi:hypothetical protein
MNGSRVGLWGERRLADGTEIAATGETAEIPTVTVREVRDGKFVSLRGYYDGLGGGGPARDDTQRVGIQARFSAKRRQPRRTSGAEEVVFGADDELHECTAVELGAGLAGLGPSGGPERIGDRGEALAEPLMNVRLTG